MDREIYERKRERLEIARLHIKNSIPQYLRRVSVRDDPATGEPTFVLKLSAGAEDRIVLTYDTAVQMYKPDGYQSAGGLYIKHEDLEYYLNSRTSLLAFDQKQRRGFFLISVGAVLGLALAAYSCARG